MVRKETTHTKQRIYMELKPGNRLPETHPTPHHHCNLTHIRSPWVCESLSEDLHLTPQCSLWSQLHRQHEAGGLVFPPTIRLSTCMTAHFSFNNTKLLMAQFVVTKYCTGKNLLHTVILFGFSRIKTEQPVFYTNLPITVF